MKRERVVSGPRVGPPDAEIRSRLDRTQAALGSAGFDGLLAFAGFLAKDGVVPDRALVRGARFLGNVRSRLWKRR